MTCYDPSMTQDVAILRLHGPCIQISVQYVHMHVHDRPAAQCAASPTPGAACTLLAGSVAQPECCRSLCCKECPSNCNVPRPQRARRTSCSCFCVCTRLVQLACSLHEFCIQLAGNRLRPSALRPGLQCTLVFCRCLQALLQGKESMFISPDLQFPCCDVRDAARAHILAAEMQCAKGRCGTRGDAYGAEFFPVLCSYAL